VEVVKEAVNVNENSRRASTEERTPPPAIIFYSELKVGKCDRNERCDDQED